MRDNRVQYQYVVEDQMELVCRYLPDCTLTFANQAYCRYHEKSGAELIGKKLNITNETNNLSTFLQDL